QVLDDEAALLADDLGVVPGDPGIADREARVLPVPYVETVGGEVYHVPFALSAQDLELGHEEHFTKARRCGQSRAVGTTFWRLRDGVEGALRKRLVDPAVEARLKRVPARLNELGYDPWGFS